MKALHQKGEESEQTVTDLKGQLEVANSSLGRCQADLIEAQSEIERLKKKIKDDEESRRIMDECHVGELKVLELRGIKASVRSSYNSFAAGMRYAYKQLKVTWPHDEPVDVLCNIENCSGKPREKLMAYYNSKKAPLGEVGCDSNPLLEGGEGGAVCSESHQYDDDDDEVDGPLGAGEEEDGEETEDDLVNIDDAATKLGGETTQEGVAQDPTGDRPQEGVEAEGVNTRNEGPTHDEDQETIAHMLNPSDPPQPL